MAPGHMPTFDDLYKHAGELMRNEYSDEQLVLAGIDLLLAEPFAPFGIEVSNSRITTALASLLQRIRKDASTTSGQEFASALSAAVKEARSALEEDSFPWSQVLVGTGLLILAATGVGLAVAAPAGLAGAAAITATMATFGPGGMAGGIATLAVLSGTSMAFTTTGLTLEGKSAPQFAKLQQTMAQEVAQLPSAAFRTALAGLLAVTSARRRLNLPSIATEVEATLLSIQATVLHEYSLHRQVATGSDPTKDWANKRDILDTALSWLAKKAKDDGIPSEIRQAVVAAIEGSTASPALPRSGPPRAITAGDNTPDPGDDS